MLPQIGNNDLVITKKYNTQTPQTNDVVAYYRGEQLVIHKVILEIKDSSLYVTKGDNNYYQDNEMLRIEEIVGRVVLKIPFLGIIFKIIQSPITSILIVIYLLILYKYNKMIEEKRLKRREKKVNNEQSPK